MHHDETVHIATRGQREVAKSVVARGQRIERWVDNRGTAGQCRIRAWSYGAHSRDAGPVGCVISAQLGAVAGRCRPVAGLSWTETAAVTTWHLHTRRLLTEYYRPPLDALETI